MTTKKAPVKKIKIQDSPTQGNFTKEEIRAAIKVAKKSTPKTKKSVAPPKVESRPMEKLKAKSNTWGKMLTREELLALLDKLDQKKKDREMSKMSETLKKALEKKQGKTHVDGSDASPTTDTKKKVKTAPPTGKKPPTRSAGRGR
jgi:hypothetical protein